MNITVYCGAHEGNNPNFISAAAELGAWMASKGHRLIYGSGKDGMMGAVSEALLQGGGEAVGVTPEFFIEAEETRDDLTELIVTEDMHIRRKTMIDLGDAFIALPGGTGTIDEITEVIAIKRLGMLGEKNKPVMLYNVDGYFDSFFEFLSHMASQGFCRETDRDNVLNVQSIGDIERALETAGAEDDTRNKKYF